MPEKIITAHNLILEGRKKLTLSGVTDVDAFDEGRITLYTSAGALTVKGRELHVGELSLENGEMTVEGEISSLIYGDRGFTEKPGLLAKLFR